MKPMLSLVVIAALSVVSPLPMPHVQAASGGPGIDDVEVVTVTAVVDKIDLEKRNIVLPRIDPGPAPILPYVKRSDSGGNWAGSASEAQQLILRSCNRSWLRSRWIDSEHFFHALSHCMLSPGPEAQQLAIYTGQSGDHSFGHPEVVELAILTWEADFSVANIFVSRN